MLRRARSGDDAAFAQLIRHYDPGLRTLVFTQLRQAELMDRALSTTYLKAYRKVRSLPTDTEPGAWLAGLAAQACAEELRRQAQRRREPRRRTQPTPEGETPVDVSSRLDVLRKDAADQPLPKLTPMPVDLTERAAEPLAESEPGADAEADAEAEAHAEPGAGAEAEPGAGADPGPAADQAPVEAPDHLPGFWNQLGRHLLAEREIPARPVESMAPAAAGGQGEAASRLSVRQGDGRALATAAELPGTVEELAQQHRTGNRAVSFLRRLGVIVLVVGAVAGLGYLAYRIGGNAKPINRTGMTSANLAGQVVHTLNNSTSITGTLTHTEIDTAGQHQSATYDFTSTDNGSFRLHGTNVADDVSYDASQGTRQERALPGGPTQPAVQSEADGLATGPPDPSSGVDGFFDGDLAAVLRAMRANPDTPATSVTFAGRPAWSIVVPLAGGSGIPDTAQLIVDKQLLVPADLVFRVHGRAVREYRLDGVSLDQPVAVDTFTVAFGEGDVNKTDSGFRRTTLNEIPGAPNNYVLATPTYLPDGYSLAEVAVHAGPGDHTGPNGSNPVSQDVVSLTYRRGWERITITTRHNTGTSAEAWADPFVSAPPVPHADTVRLDGGKFRLVRAHRVVTPGYVPHLWGATRDTVFTVSGDLTAGELQRVAESLH